ncbi:hypothetical protein [Pseudomonas sp. NPDC086566]|uniref:hypothetical protein n=1 Tax=Pseudomonas sp. NPDC086566 TaxID=3390647 RepID=UPI003D032985
MIEPSQLLHDDSFKGEVGYIQRLVLHGDNLLACGNHNVQALDRDGKVDRSFGYKGSMLTGDISEGFALLKLRSGELWAMKAGSRDGVYLLRFDAVGQRLDDKGILVFAQEVVHYNTRRRNWLDDFDVEPEDFPGEDYDEVYDREYEKREAAFNATFGIPPRGYDWCEMVEMPNGYVLLALSRSPYRSIDNRQVEARTVLLRLDQAGNLDRTFGRDGSLEIKSRANEQLFMSQMTGLRGGGVLLVGAPASRRFTHVLKLDATGQLDLSFADKGELKVPYTQYGGLKALHETEDGMLYGECRREPAFIKPKGLWPILKITSTGRIDTDYQPVLPQEMACRVIGIKGNSVMLWGETIVPDDRLHLLTVGPDGHLLKHNFVRYNADNEVRRTKFLFNLTDDGRILIHTHEQVWVPSDRNYNVTTVLKAYRL